jgi:hypothetical protein
LSVLWTLYYCFGRNPTGSRMWSDAPKDFASLR